MRASSPAAHPPTPLHARTLLYADFLACLELEDRALPAASVAHIAWYSAFPVTMKLPHFCADNGLQNWDYDFDVASNLRRRQRVPATWRVV